MEVRVFAYGRHGARESTWLSRVHVRWHWIVNRMDIFPGLPSSQRRGWGIGSGSTGEINFFRIPHLVFSLTGRMARLRSLTPKGTGGATAAGKVSASKARLFMRCTSERSLL